NLVARLEDGLRQEVDDSVRTRSDRDLLETNVVPLCKRRAQSVRAAVGIPVEVACGSFHCFESGRKRPERSLVRRELDDTLQAELALDFLHRLARLVRNEFRQRRADEAAVGHSVFLPDFFRQKKSVPPIVARSVAIADLFSPACSPVPGTAAFAF